MSGVVIPLLICFPFCPMAPRRPLETQVKLWPDVTDIRDGMKWGQQLKQKISYFPELAVISNVNTYRPSLDLQ